MKKIIFTVAITLGLAFGASAQSDGFFNNYSMDGGQRSSDGIPELPNSGQTGNQATTPLGSGLLILTALGAGYAVAKKRD